MFPGHFCDLLKIIFAISKEFWGKSPYSPPKIRITAWFFGGNKKNQKNSIFFEKTIDKSGSL